jgi:Cytochrome oxidase complex assembly protein 1
MRKTVAIVVGILVGASCVPWLRHQRFFSVLVGVTTVALAAFMVFGGVRALSDWSQKLRQPDSAQFSWWSPRRRNLLLGAVILGLLAPIVSQFVMRSTEAYKLTVATAHETPQFGQVLGAPITEGWFSDGEWVSGNAGTADLTIPVKGSRRKGNLHALAMKENGRWTLRELTLELVQPEERIDLLVNSR